LVTLAYFENLDKTGRNFLVCERIAIIRPLAEAHGTTLE